MILRNTSDSFGAISKFFHWLIALLVLIMLCVGVSFSYLPPGKLMGTLVFLHKSTGVIILGLMVMRLLWRFINPSPQFPTTMPPWQKIVSRLVHFLLYVVVIAMPITGMIMVLAAGHAVPFFGLTSLSLQWIPTKPSLSQLMNHWHNYLAWTITSLYVLHTLASLKHHFIDKDNILSRML